MRTSSVTGDTPEATVRVSGTTEKLGSQEFLRLLMAELRHQNPLEPIGGRDFMAQLAQFSNLEALHRIEDQLATLIRTQEALTQAQEEEGEARRQAWDSLQASLRILPQIEEHLARLTSWVGEKEP